MVIIVTCREAMVASNLAYLNITVSIHFYLCILLILLFCYHSCLKAHDSTIRSFFILGVPTTTTFLLIVHQIFGDAEEYDSCDIQDINALPVYSSDMNKTKSTQIKNQTFATVAVATRIWHSPFGSLDVGFKMGRLFPHCTCTILYHTCAGYRYILNHKTCGVLQNLQFLLIKIL